MAHQELSDLRLTQQPWRSGNRWTAGTRILSAATATAFRSTKDTAKKTELLIFLTPRIITGEKGEANP